MNFKCERGIGVFPLSVTFLFCLIKGLRRGGEGVVLYLFFFSCASEHDDLILQLPATPMRIMYPKYVYENNFVLLLPLEIF